MTRVKGSGDATDFFWGLTAIYMVDRCFFQQVHLFARVSTATLQITWHKYWEAGSILKVSQPPLTIISLVIDYD